MVLFRVGRELTRAQNYTFIPPRRYQITNPDGLRTMNDDRLFHVRWNLHVASGRGLAPLGTARALRSLMYRLDNSLADEANAPVGYFLPLPTDGDGQSGTVVKLREDIASLRGRIAVIETTRTGWGEGPRGGGRDLRLERLRPSYPRDNVAMFMAARQSVLAACGMPVALADNSDGGSQRESWRRYLHGTVAPLGKLIALEAERIGSAITLDWDQLLASDIQGRARAFQSLVGGGMDIAEAAAVSGERTAGSGGLTWRNSGKRW